MKSLTYCESRRYFPDVTFLDYSMVFIDNSANIRIGESTIVEPLVKLTGRVKIGKNCKISFGFAGHNIECGDSCELGGKISDSKFGNNCRLGTFAEIKRSRFGDGVNCIHHCYIGDAEVGNGVNIGAGVITANFDGSKKNKTVIEDGAFIGTNVNLIAPIKIGAQSLIAAGSTVTKDVPRNAMAISRAPEIIKDNFWQKIEKVWQGIKK